MVFSSNIFLFCGLWHGAAYIFIVWGMFLGFLLTIERLLSNRFGYRPAGMPGLLLTLLLVMIGWLAVLSQHHGCRESFR
jgi:alginate O-acetyltransferase complex protein AlgI